MVLKKHFREEGDDQCQESKRRFALENVVRDAMNRNSLLDIVSELEPLFRRVVSEEVERGIREHLLPRSSVNEAESSQSRAWQLQLGNTLPSTIFTNSSIESVDNKPVQILLVDSSSKRIITSGPLSSLKVEVVVLYGDFDIDDGEDWTETKFNAKIVRAREGKRPLVTGDLVVTLRDGVGYFRNISFTDNSSWIRSRKFRLGVRVQRISTEVQIREAVSEAFVVKDQRGESYKKHHPPSAGDEIWRLEGIAKDGVLHKRLGLHGVSSVRDVLRLYITDPAFLRNMLGCGTSNKGWKTIIDHATACVPDDDQLYAYTVSDSFVLVFNSVFKVVGATFDGQNYQLVDKLDMTQMRLVEDVKLHAYKHLNDLVLIDDPSIVGIPTLFQPELLSDSSLDSQNFNFPVGHEQLEMQVGTNHMTTSLPYNHGVGDEGQLLGMASTSHQTQTFIPPLGRNSYISSDLFHGGGCVWGGSDDNFQAGTPSWLGKELSPTPSNQAFGKKKSRARWCKIRAAITFGISIRRIVAARRMARRLYPDF